MKYFMKKSLIKIIAIILATAGPTLDCSHATDQGSIQRRPSASGSRQPQIDEEKLAATLLKLHLEVAALKNQVNYSPAFEKSLVDRIAAIESVVGQLSDQTNSISESVNRGSKLGEHVVVIKDSLDALVLQIADIRKDIDRLREQRNDANKKTEPGSGLSRGSQTPSSAASMSKTLGTPNTHSDVVDVPSVYSFERRNVRFSDRRPACADKNSTLSCIDFRLDNGNLMHGNVYFAKCEEKWIIVLHPKR